MFVCVWWFEHKVFLGENYYTDRTLKQTVDVLRRRDKTLQSQIHSLKAEIDDFQTEASFFANTSSEAAVCFFCWCFILFNSAYAS